MTVFRDTCADCSADIWYDDDGIVCDDEDCTVEHECECAYDGDEDV